MNELQDLFLEKKILSISIININLIDQIMNSINIDDFYYSGNRIIFDSIIKLIDLNSELSLVALIDFLEREKKITEVGGYVYLMELAYLSPLALGLDFYIKKLKELSIRRVIKQNTLSIIENIEDISKDLAFFRQLNEISIEKIETSNLKINKIYKAKELINDFIDEFNKKRYKKSSDIKSGYKDLDEILNGFKKSDFIVIGARPSIGKTALAISMISNIILKDKIACGFFSLEMSSSSITERLIYSWGNIDGGKIQRGFISKADISTITSIAQELKEAPLYVCDTPNMDIIELKLTAKRMVYVNKIKILFIDYIGLISVKHRDVPRHEQVSFISRQLKALSRELNIPVIALSQLTRDSEGKEPNLSNLRESGAIEQDADVVMLMHRERQKTNEAPLKNIDTKILIAKQRNGAIGERTLTFIPNSTRFENKTYHQS